MKTCVVLFGALLAAAVVFAKEKPPKEQELIALDQVQPFPQQNGETISEKAAVKFKPRIRISVGCHSFPAVNAEGKTTAGLMINGTSDDLCNGSKHGSQVYGRTTWYRGKWAMLYAWYFPRYHDEDYRYDWAHVVVWLDNPAVANPTYEAVSVWEEGYRLYTNAVRPDSKFMDDVSVKLDLGKPFLFRVLSLTTLPGQYQPLILWDQLSDNVQRALDSADWGTEKPAPMSDLRFARVLKDAWPFA